MSRLIPFLFLFAFASSAVAFDQSIYVWQQDWRQETIDAVARMNDVSANYKVLALNAGVADNGTVTLKSIPVSWAAFDESRGVCPVLRANATFARAIIKGKREETANAVAEKLHEVLTAARRAGVNVTGFEVDYDCPTRKLRDYRAFVAELSEMLPGVKLSITTLPTWLKSSQFARLVEPLDHFVLQVHSLEKPTTVDAPLRLYDLSALPRCFRRAAATGTAFKVALPTYGYHVVYDRAGLFHGLQAEGPAIGKPGYTERLVFADPVEMAAVVRQLRADTPSNCRGIAWFRLPVDTDTLNWSYHGLRAVMKGRRPDIRVDAAVVENDSGLFDIRVENSGQQNVIGGRVEVALNWPAAVIAHDAVGPWKLRRNGDTAVLTGPMPELDEPRRIAWLRVAGNQSPRIQSARVVERK
jgi:hypothetical protein